MLSCVSGLDGEPSLMGREREREREEEEEREIELNLGFLRDD